MDRTLRWYERLLVDLLVRSPRIDSILILQFPGKTPAERRAKTARMLQLLRHEQELDKLERLFHSEN